MQQGIAVGMAPETFGMRDLDAANLQRYAAFELMRIPAVADASFWFQGFQSCRWSLVVRRWQKSNRIMQPATAVGLQLVLADDRNLTTDD